MALALVSRGGGRGARSRFLVHLRWPFDPIRGGPGGSWDREAGTGKLGASCHGPRSTVHAPRPLLAEVLPPQRGDAGHDAHGSGVCAFGARDTTHGRAALTGYHTVHFK